MSSVLNRALATGCVAIVVNMGEIGAGMASAETVSGIELAKRATVGLFSPEHETFKQTGKGHFVMQASGVHLHDGYILTAHHAVERDERGKRIVQEEIRVLTTDLEELPAKLVGVSAFLDIAVYRLTDGAGRLPNVGFAEREPQAGDAVLTIGYPLGWGPAFGFGRIGNPNTFLPTAEGRLMQLALAACSGNSGGGLFNEQGELVGVMHAIIETEKEEGPGRCSQFAFAVPGPLVHRVVAALIRGEQPAFSRLGIGLTAVQMGTRWRVAASDVMGPARDAGIQKGDVILAIDETEITAGAQLKNYLIERTTPGQKVAVKLLRGQQERTVVVTLGRS